MGLLSAFGSELRRPGRIRRGFAAYKWCYIFLLPTVVTYAAFTLWPIVASWYFALFDWNGVGWPEKYVGLANLAELLRDKYFWHAMGNTFVFSLAQTAIKLPVALGLAMILNNPRLRGASAYRALYFLPVVTTTAVIGIVMTFILNPYSGALNNLLTKAHLISAPVDWLGIGSTAMLMLILVAAWQMTGQYMVFWLAGLQSIPVELYEVAKVDGAGGWQSFRHITLPLLKPIGAVIILLGLSTVTLGEEVEQIKRYIAIQKARFEDRIDLRLEVPPFLSDHPLIKLTLQPLVENACLHGLELSGGRAGRITIRAGLTAGVLAIEVADNGSGMTAAQLAGVRAMLASGAGDDRHIGLRNVHERIRLRYGREYGLAIESEEGRGTRVVMRLPARGRRVEEGRYGA